MNLLIDTHLLLWCAFVPKRVSEKARDLLENTDHTLWFSAASIWEVAIKRALDRPDFRTEPSVLRAGLLANGYQELPIDGRHCLSLVSLPRLHGDPFDRLLLSQAMSEGMLLLTADTRLTAYDGPVELV